MSRSQLANLALIVFVIAPLIAATLYAIGNVFWVFFATLGLVAIVTAWFLGAA